MSTFRIQGVDAWKSLLKSNVTRWDTNIGRFSEPLAIVEHTPKFTVTADDSYFCIGSCFARNVEEHLIYSGQKVLSRRIISPREEYTARPNGFINKFTTISILNEIEWLIKPPIIDASLFDETEQGWYDLQLARGALPVTLERAIERRHYLLTDYFARLRQPSVIIMTLGLNEVWGDGKSGRYLNAAPSFFSVRRDPGRYAVEITDVNFNVTALERIFVGLRLLQPSVRLIITVSPVPMSETFSGRDIAVANTLSKATLRVAAEEFARNHADVDYYPSFDMVSLSPRASAYGSDCLHVTDRAVGMIMNHFLRHYLGKETSPAAFNELAYLAANPDVEAALRLGQFESGFEHWHHRGKAERRALAPKDGPTKNMITAGAV